MNNIGIIVFMFLLLVVAIADNFHGIEKDKLKELEYLRNKNGVDKIGLEWIR